MGLMEDRWERRRRERERQEEQQAAQRERSAPEAELETVLLSTLCTAPKPFEQVGIVQSEPCHDAQSALLGLEQAARAAGCDAVLGVGFSSFGGPVQVLFAYGTGVRWLPSAPERNDG